MANKELEEFKKDFNKVWAELIVENQEKFEHYYIGLYKTLKERYESEFQLLYSLESKVDFLQELMDEINEANHDAYKTHNISEIAEKYTNVLDGLSKVFERKMQDLYTPSIMKRNEYPTIFKDDLSFNLFLMLHDEFKDKKNVKANYSFIYYAMTEDKDKYITCRPVDYLRFLRNEEFNKDLEKVDSRQSGENKKLRLYNSLKRELLTKTKQHNKSTLLCNRKIL